MLAEGTLPRKSALSQIGQKLTLAPRYTITALARKAAIQTGDCRYYCPYDRDPRGHMVGDP